MISIVITSFKEPKSIGKALEAIIKQDIKKNYELIVSAPDNETLNVAKGYQKKEKRIKIFKDPGKGKSYAINLLLPKLKGEIFIFTDGDVYLANNSINNILREFKDKHVGCVTGKPVPLEKRDSKYGFWAQFLFDSAHNIRKKLKEEGKFFECSGYLQAYRKGIIDSIPLDVADDSIIPHMCWEKGYKIGYAEKALVYVKNVDNWKDWIKQKTRTSKSHETTKKYINLKKSPRMKTFSNEARGVIYALTYPKSLKEYYWMSLLIFARLYMWIKVFYETRLENKHYSDNWERVESTK